MTGVHRTHLSTLVAAAFATLAAPPVSARGVIAQDATIEGTVVDSTGITLPGVTVETRRQAGDDVVASASTDGSGRFIIGMLIPGRYTVTFSLPGFITVVRDDVEAEAGAVVAVHAELRVQLAETVVSVGRPAAPAAVVPTAVVEREGLPARSEADITSQLEAVDTSFNRDDAATIGRAGSLLNMSPDHTLVLVNGKRRHRGAVIAWLGNGMFSGSQGSDLSAIPSIALDQVDVRHGSLATYAAGAFAGVLNFKLRSARSGGSIAFRTGRHYTENDGDQETCGPIGRSCNGIGGFAHGFTFAGNAGLPLGSQGFVNLSLEYGGTQPTNRAVQDGGTRAVIAGGNKFVRDTSRVWGSSLVEDDLKLFANFATGGNRAAEFYGHANYASKRVTGGFHFRNPNNGGGVYSIDGGKTLLVGDILTAQGMGSANCPTIAINNGTPDPVAFAQVSNNPYCFTFHQPFHGASDGLPGGFTPQFGGDVRDYSVVAGVRGETSMRFRWDVSGNIGQNQVDAFLLDTVNASLGPDSPTRFQPNVLEQTDTSLNADLSYAAGDMVKLAGGIAWRNEQYHLGAGDQESWAIGPYGAQGFSSAANGYSGTHPENSGTWDRPNFAVYGNLEVHDVNDEWRLGTAVRREDFYDSFGGTINSTLGGRYSFTDKFTLRATVSRGFRAPTPGQQNALNVTSEFNYKVGDLTNKHGTVPSSSALAALWGGMPLKPEKGINYSVGTAIDSCEQTETDAESCEFILTADYFRINLFDRLTLTKNHTLTQGEVAALLANGADYAGTLTSVRFFVNDFSTRTQGVSVVAEWTPRALGERTTFTGAYNFIDTAVTEFSEEHFNANRITSLTLGLPRTRWNASVNHVEDRWTLNAILHFYGSYWDRADARSALGTAMSHLYPLYSGKPLLDLKVGFPFDDITLDVGAQNVFNTYPDENPGRVEGVGNRYGRFGPFGINGGYYYVRVNYGWGASEP